MTSEYRIKSLMTARWLHKTLVSHDVIFLLPFTLTSGKKKKKKKIKYLPSLCVIRKFSRLPCFKLLVKDVSLWTEKRPRLTFSLSRASKKELCSHPPGGAVFHRFSSARNSQAPSGAGVVTERTSSRTECAGVRTLSRIRRQLDGI